MSNSHVECVKTACISFSQFHRQQLLTLWPQQIPDALMRFSEKILDDTLVWVASNEVYLSKDMFCMHGHEPSSSDWQELSDVVFTRSRRDPWLACTTTSESLQNRSTSWNSWFGKAVLPMTTFETRVHSSVAKNRPLGARIMPLHTGPFAFALLLQ